MNLTVNQAGFGRVELPSRNVATGMDLSKSIIAALFELPNPGLIVLLVINDDDDD